MTATLDILFYLSLLLMTVKLVFLKYSSDLKSFFGYLSLQNKFHSMASNAFLYLTPRLFGGIFQHTSFCLCYTFALPMTGCASLCLLLPVMFPHYYSTDHASFKI